MSIDTELARLTNAKAAIKAAIEGKGVTVPDGTLLDGMASLIEGIEAGGGDATLTYGTYTPSSDAGTIEIEHGLGIQPKYFIEIAQLNSSDVCQYDNLLSLFSVQSDGNVFRLSIRHSSATNITQFTTRMITDCTYSDLSTGSAVNSYGLVKQADTTKVIIGNDSSFYRFRAGIKIYWLAKG